MLNQIGEEDEHYSLALALKGRIAMIKEDWEAAMKYFESSLDVNDANSLTYYYKASLHELKGERDEAIRCLMDAVDVDPEFALARAELAGHLVAIGDYNGALDHCNFILHSNPAVEQALYWKARALFLLGRNQEALKIVERYDDYADTYAVRLGALAGEVQHALDHPKEAKTFFLKAFKENPSLFPDEALVKLAKLYMDEGRPAEALRIMKARFFEIDALTSQLNNSASSDVYNRPNIDLSASVTLNAGSANENLDLLHRAYGALLFNAGDVEASLASFKKSLDINPKQLDVHLEYVRLLIVGASAYDAALNALDEAEKHFPADIGIKKMKITTLAGIGEVDAAWKILNDLEAEPFGITQPTDAATHVERTSTSDVTKQTATNIDSPLLPWRLVLLLASDKVGEAEQLFHQIYENKAYDPLGTLNLARAAFMLGLADSCKHIVRHRLVSTPGMPLSILSLTVHFVEHEMQDLELNTWVLTQIAKQNPSHVYFLSQLARTRAANGDFDFAITVLKHVTTLVPYDAVAYETIGNYYTITLRHIEALTFYKRAQECEGPEPAIFVSATKEALSLIALGRFDNAIDKLEALTARVGPNIRLFSDIALRLYGTLLAGEFKEQFGFDVPNKYVDIESAIPILRAALSQNIASYTNRTATHQTLARCLQSIGRQSEADEHFKMANELTTQSNQ